MVFHSLFSPSSALDQCYQTTTEFNTVFPPIISSNRSLSLIICTYCRVESLRKLLESLRQQTRLPEEILIIDGSPEADVGTLFNTLDTALPLKYHKVDEERRGLTRQRNFGVVRATGDIVAFLDDDTIPESDYFENLLLCFSRHPDAVGVGGYISNETKWQKVNGGASSSIFRYTSGDWERREDIRWRLRRMLGLASPLLPGWMPPSGHGRPVGYLPPDGNDHKVEFVMGGASSWRRGIFNTIHFSDYFDGYGLYEDMDFCIRASRDGQIYICGGAKLAHHHAPSGRPNRFRYGVMVVRNGWYVWRQRWLRPAVIDRIRWWLITALLACCRLGNGVTGPSRIQAISEFAGRFVGMISLILRPVRINER